MVSIIILEGVPMKINKHCYLFQNKDNWREKLKMVKDFHIKHEAEIREHQLEYVSLVDDYKGDPIRIDDMGKEQDWFAKLYFIRYETKLRILAA